MPEGCDVMTTPPHPSPWCGVLLALGDMGSESLCLMVMMFIVCNDLVKVVVVSSMCIGMLHPRARVPPRRRLLPE